MSKFTKEKKSSLFLLSSVLLLGLKELKELNL